MSLEKYIRIEHHDAHCYSAYYLSGFKEDTLIISLDGGGDNHVAKYYFGNSRAVGSRYTVSRCFFF